MEESQIRTNVKNNFSQVVKARRETQNPFSCSDPQKLHLGPWGISRPENKLYNPTKEFGVCPMASALWDLPK